jgi:hypothetical protein
VSDNNNNNRDRHNLPFIDKIVNRLLNATNDPRATISEYLKNKNQHNI